jgi:rare lipoprotein A
VKATLLPCLLAGLLSLVLAGGAAAQAPEGPQPEALAAIPSVQPELERGKATWYGPKFHGRRTSSGERFDMNELTAAHETLPFGTRVRVRNVANGREVVVRINDRTHRVGDRIIDLSKAAAAALGFLKAGAAQVVLIGP